MRMLKWLLLLLPTVLLAQSVPNGTIVTNEVWTASQWNLAWQSKADLATTPAFTGTPTAGHCVSWASATSIQDAGSTCANAPAFSAITSATNTSAAMLVGSGASLGFSGSGTIGASSVTGFNPTAGKTLSVTNSITLGGADSTTFTFPGASDTVTTNTATQTLTNKSIAASEINSGQLAIAQGGTGTASPGLINGTNITITGSWPNQTITSTAGGGNVSNSGTPTQYQTATWVSSTAIQGVGPGTTGQALVSGGASAYPSYSSTLSNVTNINGTAIPSSATLVTVGGALGTPSSGTLTSATGLPISTGVSGLATGIAAFLAANTTFTITPTGCTPSAHSGSAFSGTITLATGPCTSIIVTMNGATGYTAAHGFACFANDQTAQNAGTWIPTWGQSASSTTTATIPIPTAAGATDVISFACTPN
jgi:hypothetical protein